MTEEISQITIAVDGEQIAFGVPFTKINVKDRTVEGFATLDNIDKSGEIVDNAASKEAFGQWLGNVREMHSPKAVGKAVSVEERTLEKDGKTYNGFWVKSRISKGAEDTWQKILDGTLAGYSIGGRVFERRPEVVKSSTDGKFSSQRINRITKYMLGELSVVDNPMNPLSMLEGISKGYLIKMVGENLYEGDGLVENKGLFYCATCDVAKMDDLDYIEVECPTCDQKAFKIGEVSESPTVTDLRKMVDIHLDKAAVPPQLVGHQFKPKGDTTATDAPDGAMCADCGKPKSMHPKVVAKAAVDLMCPNCGSPLPDGSVQCVQCQTAGSGATISPVPKVEAVAKDITGNVDNQGVNQIQSEDTSGFGAPTDLTPQPVMEAVNNYLRHEVNLPEGNPQSLDPTPSVGKSDALDAQKAEGDELVINKEAIMDALSEALNSRVEIFRRSHRKKTEDVMFVEALLDMDMYRVTNSNKTPPKGKPTDISKYADPDNYKYPIDTPARIRSAMAYFNAPGQRVAGGYSMVQWSEIGKRIASAANSVFAKGHAFSDGRVVGPNATKVDNERGEMVINLQKNDSNGNNIVVGVLQTLAGYLRESTDDSPINKGGETQTLDINKELGKILDILQTATKEFGDVMKAFTVTAVNSENASGPTIGGESGDTDAGVGTDEANDGNESFSTNEVTTAKDVSLPAPDNGPDKVLPNAIATDGTGADPGVTADSGPEKVLPHADLGSVAKSDPSSEIAELLKTVVSKVDDLGGRMETIETSGGGKKSGEVSEKLSKSDEGSSFWSSTFYAGELDNR